MCVYITNVTFSYRNACAEKKSDNNKNNTCDDPVKGMYISLQNTNVFAVYLFC